MALKKKQRQAAKKNKEEAKRIFWWTFAISFVLSFAIYWFFLRD